MFNDHRRCVGGMLRAKSQSRALPALLVALTISLSLSGCVAGTFDRHFGNERPEATGRVLLSIGEVPKKLVNSPYTEDALNFRQLGGSTGMVRYRARGYWGGWIDGDFDDERGHGEVRLIHLEPGDYRIENFLFSRGPGNSYAEAKDKFSIPFTVKAGETVYLGRYMFMGAIGRGIFNIHVPGGGVVLVLDAHDEDLAMAAKRGLIDGSAPVQNAVPLLDARISPVVLRVKKLPSPPIEED